VCYGCLYSGDREPGFEHLIEVGSQDKSRPSGGKAEDNYKKMGYIRPSRKLHQFVKSHHIKNKVIIRTCIIMPVLILNDLFFV